MQRVAQRLVTTGEPLSASLGTFAAWGAPPEDARALSMVPIRRLGVYGVLIAGTVLAGTVLSAVKNQLAGACARLPEAKLQAIVGRFLGEDPPRSPCLRDLPSAPS